MLRNFAVLSLLSCVLCAAPVFAGEKNPVVVVETTSGSFEIELFADKAPITVKNFLMYVTDKFYDDTVFHRVMDGFMIQGGGFTADLKEKETKATIKNEADNGLKNTVGTIAMARLPDPNSASAQFFINVNDNESLDHHDNSAQGFGYCVFGKVSSGIDVVMKIKASKTGNKIGEIHGQRVPLQNVPIDTVTIKSVTEKK